jgi:hypothetical protein
VGEQALADKDIRPCAGAAAWTRFMVEYVPAAAFNASA